MSFTSFLATQWGWVAILFALMLMLTWIEWLEHGHGLKVLSLQETIRFLNDKKNLAFDLRPEKTYKLAHITHTKNINPQDLQNHPEHHIKKKENKVLLICENNSQSRKIGKLLSKQGYKEIYLLKDGLGAWRKEKLPLGSI